VPEVRRAVDNGRALQDLLVQAGPRYVKALKRERASAVAVRDHRNAVRDRSESLPQSIGTPVRNRRNPHHAGKSGYTTQIGSDTFTVFRTGPSKSRLAFLSRLCGGTALHAINDAALDYMKDHPHLRDKAENLRRNRQRHRPRCP
jgi:hypothetical protein